MEGRRAFSQDAAVVGLGASPFSLFLFAPEQVELTLRSCRKRAVAWSTTLRCWYVLSRDSGCTVVSSSNQERGFPSFCPGRAACSRWRVSCSRPCIRNSRTALVTSPIFLQREEESRWSERTFLDKLGGRGFPGHLHLAPVISPPTTRR